MQAQPIISAVVAPALLILACSSLITTTANRLSLLLSRVRKLTQEMEIFYDNPKDGHPNKRGYVAAQLRKGTERAQLLQRSLATLYLALGSLVLTSVCVGVGAASGIHSNFIAVTALASVIFLFYASTLLIRESRIALSAVKEEMKYVSQLTA